jgi:hypothetical protein
MLHLIVLFLSGLRVLKCLLVQLDVVGREQTLLAVIRSEPPVLIRKF